MTTPPDELSKLAERLERAANFAFHSPQLVDSSALHTEAATAIRSLTEENEFRKGLARDALNEVAALTARVRELERRYALAKTRLANICAHIERRTGKPDWDLRGVIDTLNEQVAAQNAALTEEREAALGAARAMEASREEMKAERDTVFRHYQALTARVGELEAALRPFAEMKEHILNGLPPDAGYLHSLCKDADRVIEQASAMKREAINRLERRMELSARVEELEPLENILLLCGEGGGKLPNETTAGYLRRLINEYIAFERDLSYWKNRAHEAEG